MSNRTSLVALDDPMICPGYRSDYQYDYKTQHIGDTAWSIPFIWLALFREEDLVLEDVPMDGNSVPVMVPLVERAKALQQLEAAIEALTAAFPEAPQLGDYVRYMLQEVGLFRHRYFTIDLIEIEDSHPPGSFRKLLRHCLAGFSDPSVTVAWEKPRTFLRRMLFLPAAVEVVSWRQSLGDMSGLKEESPIPPADIPLRDEPYPEDAAYNFYRLMPGAEFRKSVWVS